MTSQWKEVSLGLQSQDEAAVLQALQQLSLQEKSLSKEVTARLLPRCLDKLQHRNISVRAHAMEVIAKQLEYNNGAVGTHVDDLSKRLTQQALLDLRAGTSDAANFKRLHCSLCSVISELQGKFPKKFMPYFKPLGAYLVDCTCSANKEIAASACSYWAKLQVPPVPNRYMDIWIPVVLTKLQKLIPALIQCMIYHPDLASYKEGQIPKTARGASGDDVSNFVESLSNCRNYAALGFENLCKIFQTEIIALFKPYMEKYLYSDDWLQVEAIILALGAFTQALGTPKEMRDVYPKVLPKLIEMYSHEQPLVRSITCFTMQQFINFNMKGVKDPLSKIIRCTLALLGDELHETRVMALRTVATLLAYSDRDLAPYIDKMVDALIKLGATIKGDALYIYYECIGHLFGRMGEVIEDQNVTALMEPLMNHWRTLEYTELETRNVEDTVMICQPLSLIASHSKANFARYAESIFDKVSEHLQGILHGSPRQELNGSSLNTHMVAVMDVVSAIYEGQGAGIAHMGTKYKFDSLVLEVLKERDFHDSTHQSAMALLGHLCSHSFDAIEPNVDDFLEVCTKKLDSRSAEVQNNALWCIANIAKNLTKKNDHLMALADRMSVILSSPDSDQGQAINAALALTHMGRHWPADMVQLLTREDVFMMLCTLLQMPFQRDLEKTMLLGNLCAMLSKYLKKLPKDTWAPFCTVIAVCDCEDDSLAHTLKTFLKDLRTAVGTGGWNTVSNQLGAQLTVTLRKKYKLY